MTKLCGSWTESAYSKWQNQPTAFWIPGNKRDTYKQKADYREDFSMLGWRITLCNNAATNSTSDIYFQSSQKN